MKEQKRKWATETVYAITSLTAAQASPAKLAAMLRGHWAIEDRLRWIRDVIYDEDRSQIRTASGPASWPPSATCHQHPPPDSPRQHRRRPPLQRPATRSAPADPPEMLTGFAEAVGGRLGI